MNLAEALPNNTCALSKTPLTASGKSKDSLAHVIPSAIGGRLKFQGILCAECNDFLNINVDEPLTDIFPADAMKTLQIKKDRKYKDPKAKLKAVATGEEWKFDQDSPSITPAKPKIERKVLSEDSTQIDFSGDEASLRALLKSQKLKPGTSINDIIARAPRQVGPAPELMLGLGGIRTDTIRRSAWTTAALFAAERLRIMLPEWQRYILTAYKAEPGIYGHVPCTGFSPSLIKFPDEYGPIAHAVALWNDFANHRLYGYVQTFGALGVCIVLATNWKAEVKYSYCVDPRSGTQGFPDFTAPTNPLFLDFAAHSVQADAKEMASKFAQRAKDIGFASSTRIVSPSDPQ